MVCQGKRKLNPLIKGHKDRSFDPIECCQLCLCLCVCLFVCLCMCVVYSHHLGREGGRLNSDGLLVYYLRREHRPLV